VKIADFEEHEYCAPADDQSACAVSEKDSNVINAIAAQYQCVNKLLAIAGSPLFTATLLIPAPNYSTAKLPFVNVCN
jgi:hypothetical protein